MSNVFLDTDGKVVSQTFMGCFLQSVSASAGGDKALGSINVVLRCAPEQTFELVNENVFQVLGTTFPLQLGRLNVNLKLVGWNIVEVNINGTSTINVRFKEIGFNFISVNSTDLLNFSQLLSAHSGGIISQNRGWELQESSRDSGEALFNIDQGPIKTISEVIQLEATGLPQTNLSKLLTPTFNTVLADVIANFDSRGIDPSDRDFAIDEVAHQRFLGYPKRTNGVRQIQVQFGPQGVKTKYSFTKFYSEIDEKIEDIRRSLDELRNSKLATLPDRKRIYTAFFDQFDFLDSPSFESSLNEVDTVDKVLDDVIEQLGGLAGLGLQIDIAQLEGGMGVVTGKSGGGPFYEVRRLATVDIDPTTFADRLVFTTEWSRVRNLAESETSPGYLLEGTQVQVQIFKGNDKSRGTPFMEQAPQIFSPPVPPV